MKLDLANILVDPISLASFSVEPAEVLDGDIVSGLLRSGDQTRYNIYASIPRLVISDDAGQLQTSDAFGFKWQKRDTYDSPQVKTSSIAWLTEKYGFESQHAWGNFYSSRRRIIDVGCGSGFSSSLWLDAPGWSGKPMWVGVDISSAIDVAQQRLGHIPNTHFVQANALYLPFRDASFDTVFSEGVLHHTPSTRNAICSATRLLEQGGEFHFYVYKRKGPVREFTDNYIRDEISSLSDEDAWNSLRSLTKLGQALSLLNMKVTVDEDVPLLGIKAGEYDVQRLLYYNFAKMFWNPSWSFEENVHVNFDWYRPKYAHRQSVDEVRAWCVEAGLCPYWLHEDESGITVRAVKDQ